ncbi:MAG TPA: hypothetical protein PLL54_03665, partial [Dermatophilaceae bacterium]|nr:hypothetical protein [Dermatophilaceae bacterium]
QLAEAASRGPLPDDHPTASLWFRLIDWDDITARAHRTPTTVTRPRPEDHHRMYRSMRPESHGPRR